MSKFIDDILKTPSGKWSKKSLFAVIAFIVSMLLAIFIVISDKVLEREVNRYAIEVLDSLLLFCAALLGIAIWDKKVRNKEPEEAPD